MELLWSYEAGNLNENLNDHSSPREISKCCVSLYDICLRSRGHSKGLKLTGPMSRSEANGNMITDFGKISEVVTHTTLWQPSPCFSAPALWGELNIPLFHLQYFQSIYVLSVWCPIYLSFFWRSDCFFCDGWILSSITSSEQKGSPRGLQNGNFSRQKESGTNILLVWKKIIQARSFFFFFFLTSRWIFVFNWSIIVLQCYISFYYTIRWISYMYKYIPSLSSFL